MRGAPASTASAWSFVLALGVALASAGCQPVDDFVSNETGRPIELRLGLAGPMETNVRLGAGQSERFPRYEPHLTAFLVIIGRCRYRYEIDRPSVVRRWEQIRSDLLAGDDANEISLDRTLSVRINSNLAVTVQPAMYFGLSERGNKVTSDHLRITLQPKAVECDR